MAQASVLSRSGVRLRNLPWGSAGLTTFTMMTSASCCHHQAEDSYALCATVNLAPLPWLGLNAAYEVTIHMRFAECRACMYDESDTSCNAPSRHSKYLVSMVRASFAKHLK